ncbi:hypothetical protein GCM10012320_32890 [Sinomonas cellulolyticus]|uniref:Uncharacterized protein n=1 Tax=Sinomonas cellulolyticus TaxID=2801916 RepID=A0ABS1JY07_9MICC|nr:MULTISPECIES: hypothetical protein [Sinomonas]MBL0703982.1 hypothetical protein [Sinomonas cellulolyticus]GHG59020.1 hypothetical protein GCM10012320_32890 [Sinomonas sp. KCTC 49339]
MRLFSSLREALRSRRRRAAVATHREALEGLQSRPAYDLDPAGRLNRDLDTDLFHALPHPQLAPVPAVADLLAETTRRVDDLHAAGALDEGSYTVLDHYLDAAHHTMDTAADRHARSQLDFLRRAETNEDRTHRETWDALAHASADLEDAEAHLAHARTALTGTPARARTTIVEARPAPARTPAPGTAQEHRTAPPAQAPTEPSHAQDPAQAKEAGQAAAGEATPAPGAEDPPAPADATAAAEDPTAAEDPGRGRSAA